MVTFVSELCFWDWHHEWLLLASMSYSNLLFSYVFIVVLSVRFIRRRYHWGDTTPMRPEPNHIRTTLVHPPSILVLHSSEPVLTISYDTTCQVYKEGVSLGRHNTNETWAQWRSHVGAGGGHGPPNFFFFKFYVFKIF